MNQAWRRFLFIRFPLSVVVLAVICQVAAVALSHVPMRRNRLDELALAVTADHAPHRILLLGDSIIRDATLQYSVGSSSEVLNLATQRIVGLPGGLLLLKRYLQTHEPPQYVVLAAAPDDYSMVSDQAWLHYYFWNTFTRPDERAFLKAYLPGIDAAENFPAAMDLQQTIFERLFAFTKRGEPHFDPLPPAADPNAPVEPVSDNLATPGDLRDRLAASNLSLAPLNAASVAGMCKLGRQYGFVFNIVWAPMPPQVLEARKASGELAALEGTLERIFTENGCQTRPVFNMNDVQRFTNFKLDTLHLRGSGWEQRAAGVLATYLHGLPDRPAASKASIGALSEGRFSIGFLQ